MPMTSPQLLNEAMHSVYYWQLLHATQIKTTSRFNDEDDEVLDVALHMPEIMERIN